MLEEEISTGNSNNGEVFLITRDDGLYLDVVEPVDLAALKWDQDVPFIDSLKHALDALDNLLNEPPRTLGCLYQFDDLEFGEMRSSVLRAGVIVLAARAGHQAIVAPISARLPASHWRSEFIFRATRGIRLLKPELSEQELLHIVTREIQFYEEKIARSDASPDENWPEEIPDQNISSAGVS